MAEAPTQAQIVAKLNDASLAPWTRARLVKQLPAVGHRDSLPVLADLLSDPDQAIRLAALGAIRNVGGPPAVDLLVNALRHEDQTTALWATQRLRQLNYLGAWVGNGSGAAVNGV